MNPFDPKHWDPCNEALDRIFEYLNQRELTDSDRAEFLRHIKDCPPCGDRFKFEETILERLKASDPCQCPERLKTRIKALLGLT